MQKEKYLEVTQVGPINEAKDGRRWQQVWMVAFLLLNGRRIYTNSPERSVNVWEQGPPSAKGLKDFSKGDPLFNTLKKGDLVEGEICTEQVEPYIIEGSEENGELEQYTMIVFPHENKKTKFARAGHPIVDADGIVHERAIVASRSQEAIEDVPTEAGEAF